MVDRKSGWATNFPEGSHKPTTLTHSPVKMRMQEFGGPSSNPHSI